MDRMTTLALVARIEAVWGERRWTPVRISQWADALEHLDERTIEHALVRFRSSHERCPSMAEFLAVARPSAPAHQGHPRTCTCGGAGWVTVTQTNQYGHRYEAFTRCPDGPSVAFVEPDVRYDPLAAESAFAMFNALSATAETREDLAQACFAAATAYRNSRPTLL